MTSPKPSRRGGAGESSDRLANLVGALVLALGDRINDVARTAAAHGAAAPAALVSLHEFLDKGSVDSLRGAVGLTHSGAVRLVDRLEESGFLRRRPGPDGRQRALTLTAQGHQAARRILAAREATLHGVLSKLSPAERRSLTTIAEKLLVALTRERLAERTQGQEPAGGWLCRMCDLGACGRPHGECPSARAAQAVH